MMLLFFKKLQTLLHPVAKFLVSELQMIGPNDGGIDRLIHTARKARHLDPAAMVDRIFTGVAEFSQRTPPEDDQTIVVVKRMLPDLEEAPA